MTNPLFRLLTALPLAEPDPVRAARVRTACHAALARRRTRRSAQPRGAARIWEFVVAGLGGIYLTETFVWRCARTASCDEDACGSGPSQRTWLQLDACAGRASAPLQLSNGPQRCLIL